MNKTRFPLSSTVRGRALVACLALTVVSLAGLRGQDEQAAAPRELISGDVVSNFRPLDTDVWKLAGHVEAVPGERKLVTAGTGTILVDVNPGKRPAAHLITKDEFGDVKVHVEFMIPAHSNSGVYLMGRYEIQILDSYGKPNTSFDELGGIYQRWNESKPKGERGYEGFTPYKNAALAPGEWQTLDITFHAPRFNAEGRKGENARFIKVVANGITVQEQQQVTGPTRSNPIEGEAATGPIVIQGDHGPIAVRSLVVTPLDR